MDIGTQVCLHHIIIFNYLKLNYRSRLNFLRIVENVSNANNRHGDGRECVFYFEKHTKTHIIYVIIICMFPMFWEYSGCIARLMINYR